FLAIEKIKGGPVSERVQDFCYRIGSRFCFSMSSFTDLLPEKVMLAMVGRSFT
ncbi:hypothetical protein ACUODJ_27280, partial [Escherichia sp. HC-CC]